MTYAATRNRIPVKMVAHDGRAVGSGSATQRRQCCCQLQHPLSHDHQFPCCSHMCLCRPFLLQSKLSMTQMGLFSISSYPYSFKLLWSPIVDSVYSAAFGRRKSWIVPVQLASAALLMFSADWIQTQYELGAVVPLTVLFFFFVLLAATQVGIGLLTW